MKYLILIWTLMLLVTTTAFAEANQCDFLLDKQLYNICVKYCTAYGDSNNTDEMMTGKELSLFERFERKAGVDGPMLPCVDYVDDCPVWTQEELDRIGTLGGTYRIDYENPTREGRELYYDREIGRTFAVQAKITSLSSDSNFTGQYTSVSTGYPDANREMVLTEAEYNGCRKMLVEHSTE